MDWDVVQETIWVVKASRRRTFIPRVFSEDIIRSMYVWVVFIASIFNRLFWFGSVWFVSKMDMIDKCILCEHCALCSFLLNIEYR